MVVTAIADIIASLESELQVELPSYVKLAYIEDVAKNTFRKTGTKDCYGIRALEADQLPGVTKTITLNQEFEVILTSGYTQSTISDASQISDSLDLRANFLGLYKRYVNGKGGLPGTILNITDLILQDPEYLDDDKVVVQRAKMNIQYRYSLI
jgi:hypothetical protein